MFQQSIIITKLGQFLAKYFKALRVKSWPLPVAELTSVGSFNFGYAASEDSRFSSAPTKMKIRNLCCNKQFLSKRGFRQTNVLFLMISKIVENCTDIPTK